MADKLVSDIFVDMITNVTYANGVLRISLARAGANNAVEPVAMMFLPGGQLPSFLKGLNDAGKNIAAQIQERADEAQKQATKKAKGGGKPKTSASSRSKSAASSKKK